ncbi:hypothetical protein Areg01_15330 [Actinoplanes regularis]|nr:hypothetical protein Areg01_15330 [Actinoplanes regularis]
MADGGIAAWVLGAPPDPRHGGGTARDNPALFPAVAPAVDWMLEMLERHRKVTGWLARVPLELYRSVRVVRISDTELLLAAAWYGQDHEFATKVPDYEAVQTVAQLLPGRGYRQVALPEPGTPLETLHKRLATRVLNTLLREDYTTVEQVAVLPDAALRDMRSVGTIGIAELRTTLAELGMTAAAPDAAAVTLSAEQATDLAELLNLLGGLARRYGEPKLAMRTAVFQHLLTEPDQGR